MIGQAPPRTHDHVAVLMGGWSAEREISLKSGAAVAAALQGQGYKVTPLDVGRDVAARLVELKPDVCFNALHGRFGEDGCIQGVLDWLGLPYTHSGVRASALAMDKAASKTVFAAAGLPVAPSRILSPEELEAEDPLPLPYVVKPVNEGSSVGVEILREGCNRRAEIARGWRFGPRIMAERYVPGRELTCAVMGDRPLGVIEIVPAESLGFYNYESKYAPGGSRHLLPAPVSPNIYELVQKLTLMAHKALGCRGVSRSDFRFDDTPGGSGQVYCLEVNTQPGMTQTSLVPELAAHAGFSFAELVSWMVEEASCSR